MAMTETSATDELRSRIAGEVVCPSDAGWDDARTAWNLAIDPAPSVVVRPTSVDDVIATIGRARECGLKVTARGTGHGAAALSTLEDTVLLNMSAWNDVAIDAEAQTARVAPGALWGDVTIPAAELGLAGLAGSAPNVAVTGYTLGGGMGWLARRYGLASNSVVAVELVTADGRHLRVDASNEPDLFWALRGGGGNFGIVTALEFKLYPVSEVFAGNLVWPWEMSRDVLLAFRDWVPTLPDDITASVKIMQLPPLEEIPEPQRGKQLAIVSFCYLGEETEGRELLAPLRDALPEPYLDTCAMMPPSMLFKVGGDPEHPIPYAADGVLLAELTPDTIDALVSVAGPGSGSPLLMVEMRQLGGVLASEAEGCGALGSINGAFTLFCVGMAITPEMGSAVAQRVAMVIEAAAPWASDGVYLNFVESPGTARRAFPDQKYRRLDELKKVWDPQGTIVANHPIA
jgi:FAD binding domain